MLVTCLSGLSWAVSGMRRNPTMPLTNVMLCLHFDWPCLPPTHNPRCILSFTLPVCRFVLCTNWVLLRVKVRRTPFALSGTQSFVFAPFFWSSVTPHCMSVVVLVGWQMSILADMYKVAMAFSWIPIQSFTIITVYGVYGSSCPAGFTFCNLVFMFA